MVQGLLVVADGADCRREAWKESVLKAGPAPHLNTGREVPEPGGRRPLEEVGWRSVKRPVAAPGQAGSAPH